MMKMKWMYAKKTITHEDVEYVERFIGIRLPESYVDCVLDNNGGRPSPCLFDFGTKREAVFENLLRIEKDHKEGIILTLERLSDLLPAGCVPFAADPFGNLLCFKYPCHGSPSVVFWDHEQDGANSISFVSRSFEELLEKLYE